ncbi:TIM barrel protein [Mucilaginibacter sabulilitoris]|uniref:TIM barrel protein n=1 Tax=Mucilaginibacter sabulilitoris TaxID=1173583 RepID=A0ABZ0TKB3_9SPHI|nr:TIM barrel protein [Mucilaginibacter sabulilitoris]WPU93602.1 TIM barrel protein [Mucilaginibacter sabulilitoris]
MILGISSFTYGWAINYHIAEAKNPALEQFLIDRTLAFGLSCLQIGDNLPVHTFDRERLYRLKNRITESGIRLEIGARELTDEHLEKYIQLADYLDVRLLRFVIDGAGFEPAAETIVKTIKKFLPRLKQKGIILGIENHDRFKSKELAGIMELIGDEHVGICLDCVNSIGAGEGLEYVAHILSPYTVNLHIKDFTVNRLSHQMGFSVEGCPAGQGLTDIDLLMEKVGRYGRCESAVLEQWLVPENVKETTVSKEEQWAKQSIDYLKQTNYFK